MTALPAGVQYGTMRLHAVAAVRDDNTDSDRDPNALPVAGTITFTPGTTSVIAADGTKVFLAAQVHGIGSDGILYDPDGQQGVKFVADFEATGWTWTVTPNLFVPGVGGDPDMPIEWPAFPVHLEPGDDLNLATEAPVASSSGTPIVRGLQGVPGPTGATGPKGDPGSITNLDTNTAALITAASTTRTALDGRYAQTSQVAAVADATATTKGVVRLATGQTSAILSTVATTGAYADLTSRPTFAAVATTGAYADLSGKPTIPSAYTDEQAQDAAAAMIAAGAHSGVSFSYNDTANSLSATVAFPNTPSVVIKPSDTSRAATTTLTMDPHLVFSSVAVGTYLIEGVVPFTGATVTGDVTVLMGGTATVATQWLTYGGSDVDNNADGLGAGMLYGPGQPTAGFPRGVSVSTATVGFYGIQPYGTVKITAVGTYGLLWAQNGSNATATVAKAGAFLRLTKIA